ncbi:oxidative stress-responsive serine-rich protein 1-like isoform X2 [Sceloporus undulatus]|nr:oxidative stress-responsive serine-rich protein 1-like isoform X2 [Sceloporus undulatus]XP_042317452.1 oxidative stress-responsive serine-rich protein 1-like isoform X2 [Sceloporus undulatus]XP_042317453.1 oxidative stress-responsive serine-rich protein 1-like isoform X2 [Sceloporus undulatus]XP_042317454.1 oxidative stress-responsive serine-rich protein 1-like isoform X2 [Sceloporus undulatus]XP_042317455.1 oxidative stress-responsive serine-rich protein 1-like isoform X2 [Sceloporus undula
MLEIEENLQAAFKKLRVDSEGSTVSLPVNEGTPSRAFLRSSDEAEVKTVCMPKESWHWCLRKSVRGTVRTQRRRRSKSPVLHPPKFIHHTTKLPSYSQPLHKNLLGTSDSNCGLVVPSSNEFSNNKQASSTLNDVKNQQTGAKHSVISMVAVQKNTPENGSTILKATDLSDFQSVSEQNKENLCACVDKTYQCKHWQDMRMYMFSGLQNALQSATEKATHMQDNSQLLPSRIPSCCLRSCSEQARTPVDDVTIEDLSGYMEYFLHIPKKMSHMAEMMYT